MLRAQRQPIGSNSLILNHMFNSQMIKNNHLSNNHTDLKTPILGDLTMTKRILHLKELTK